MKISQKEYLCFDDVLLEPQYSDLSSRSEVDLLVRLGPRHHLKYPIISANMDSITGPEMAIEMAYAGGAGILHRYTKDHEKWLKRMNLVFTRPIFSVGVQESDKELLLKLKDMGVLDVCVDIAHGNSKHCLDMVKFCKDNGMYVIAGNVATFDGAKRLCDNGADVVKAGVGPGSTCRTRCVTGHGVPQLSAIMDVCKVKNLHSKVKVIADGGIRNSGDAAKAIAAGADMVMLGGMLSKCIECPTVKYVDGVPYNNFRGMASEDAQLAFRGSVGNNTPEGVSLEVKATKKARDVVEEIAGGLRSAFSYSGARTIKEFQENAVFLKITSNTLAENVPHALNNLK